MSKWRIIFLIWRVLKLKPVLKRRRRYRIDYGSIAFVSLEIYLWIGIQLRSQTDPLDSLYSPFLFGQAFHLGNIGSGVAGTELVLSRVDIDSNTKSEEGRISVAADGVFCQELLQRTRPLFTRSSQWSGA